MGQKFRYISQADREEISRRWKAGDRVQDIAHDLRFSEKAVYRELDKGWDGTTDENLRRNYDPVLAANVTRKRLSERGRKNGRRCVQPVRRVDC